MKRDLGTGNDDMLPSERSDDLQSSWDKIMSDDEVHPPKRAFTLDQANRSLVLLGRIVGDVVSNYAQLIELEEVVETTEQICNVEKLEAARKKLVITVDMLQGCMDELDQIGVELRDFSRGIVDFPSFHDGKPISYSWLYGEERVEHWYERGAGFACRQPVCILGKKDILQPSLF